jgi:signal transduction histidine kinase
MNEKHYIPILFAVLSGFVLLNIVINFALLMVNKRRVYKLLCAFWPAVLLVFVIQSMYQTGELPIALAYAATFLPMTIFCMIGFEALNRNFPLNKYIIYYACSLILTLILHSQGFGFTTFAMPLAIATGTPLIHTFIYMNIIDRNRTSLLQKFLGILYFLLPIHCINFAVFRMGDNQIVGWLVSYALYDALAILLPSIALELANLTENDRLKALIKQRTEQLETSFKENEGLLKILLHDVSNPLMSMKFYFHRFQSDGQMDRALLDKIKLSMESIVINTKDRYMIRSAHKKLPLLPVCIDECFNEVSLIFSETLLRKDIGLKFQNHLPQGTLILADKVSFTNSVLNNLVSNALKFSPPGSLIVISAWQENGRVVLDIKDQGTGIDPKTIMKLNQNDTVPSTPGLLGETGSGYGLSIVKSIIENYGGNLEFNSSQEETNSGTNVRITLGIAPEANQLQ